MSYGAPGSEFSEVFVDGMRRRMAVSYHKYGGVADAYPSRVDALASLRLRLERYMETGNTEWLIDVANFAMIEFMLPRHSDAHYRATDSDESPGRVHESRSVVPGADGQRTSGSANLDL